MKEIIYTAVFVILGILLILLLVFMFAPWGKKETVSEKQYTPGVYTSSLTLNNTSLEIEVTVDDSHINSIRFSNLDDTVTAMYPLVQPTLEEIADQIYTQQSVDDLVLSEDNPYTSQLIVSAISEALNKAAVN